MPSLSPPLRLALPLRGDLYTATAVRFCTCSPSCFLYLRLSLAPNRSAISLTLTPSLSSSLAPFLSFCRAREGRAESRVTQRPWRMGELYGPNLGRSGTSGLPGPRYDRPNVSRAGCSLATRQAPSTARRHFPSRCGHEEQRLMVPGSVRHRPTARETRGVAALPLNGVTPFARRRAPPVRSRRDDSRAKPAIIGVTFSCAIA